MGYYTGSGVVTGGSKTIRPIKNLWWYGSHALLQKSEVQIKKYPGLPLTASSGTSVASLSASSNLLPVTDGSGSAAWVLYDVRGTRTSVSYSQISDSNLFEVVVTDEDLKVKYASGTAVTPNENNWQ